MHILIIEGPDNMGKSTVIDHLNELYTRQGLKVQVLRFPDRGDMSKDVEEYCMGNSDAVPIERQFYIVTNSVMQYAKIDKTVDILIFDRHFVVSASVYYSFDGSTPDIMYKKLLQTTTCRLAEIVGAETTTCIILTGDNPIAPANSGEHFEISNKWHKLNAKYNRIKYGEFLSLCGFQTCAVIVTYAGIVRSVGDVAELVDGLYTHVRKHGQLPSPLVVDTCTGSDEDTHRPAEV